MKITKDQVENDLRLLAEDQPDYFAYAYYFKLDEPGRVPECGVGEVLSRHDLLGLISTGENGVSLHTLIACTEVEYCAGKSLREAFTPEALETLIRFQEAQDTGLTRAEAFSVMMEEI